jgi:hypothetical protein
MLTSAKLLKDYRIAATDGDIGKVSDCLFDDRAWVIRYVAVETGSWLESREVLISPYAIGEANDVNKTLPVHITQEQVRNSPDIDTHKSVSRQHEVEYAQYYGYPYYWHGDGLWGESAYLPLQTPVVEPTIASHALDIDDPRLRSCEAVEGYRIQALDGEVGSVTDFLVEKDSWAIRYLVVDTGHWWSGNQVLMPPQWATGIHWSENTVSVNLSRDVIKAAPPFYSCHALNQQLELDFYRHYDKPTYWDRGI